MNIKSKIFLGIAVLSVILLTSGVSRAAGFDRVIVWAVNNKGTPALLLYAEPSNTPNNFIRVKGPKAPSEGWPLENPDGAGYYHWEDMSRDPLVEGVKYTYTFSYVSGSDSYVESKDVTVDTIPMVNSDTIQPQNEIVRSTSPTFTWYPVTVDPGRQISYRIRVVDSNFQTIFTSDRQLENSFTFPDGILSPKTPYLGRVEAFDSLSPIEANNRSISYWISFVTTNVIPGGPMVQENQNFSIEGLLSNEQLTKKLKKMEKNSKGKLEIEYRGDTEMGNPIWLAKMGQGPIKILIATQMHGKEPLGTEAVIDLIQQLTHSGNSMVDQILESCTIWIVPRVNPDGHEVFQRRNQQDWHPEDFDLPPNTPAPWYFSNYSGDFGYDINRDFNVEGIAIGDVGWNSYLPPLPGEPWLPGYLVTPEAQIVWKIIDEFRDEFEIKIFIDLHHQGTYVIGDTNEMCVLSVAADPNNLLSKRVNEAALRALKARENSIFGNITLYSSELGTSENATSALSVANYYGYATMLFELRIVGQKSKGYLTKIDKIGLMGILEAAATGELFTMDTTTYDSLPYRGVQIVPY